jgi:capsule polysaccharide export protein KpsE/RkpR
MGSSPAAALTINRLAATKRQLAQVEGEVNHGQGGQAPLTNVVGSFEKINFDVQFEQSLLDSALQTLAQTRAYALQQHMYLIPYVTPQPPQAAMYPERLQSTIMAAILLFCAWVVGALVFRAIEQHMN